MKIENKTLHELKVKAPKVGEKRTLVQSLVVKSVTKNEETGQRTVHGVASTEDLDRSIESIIQRGWVLKHHKDNPVFFWSHDYDIPPIGTTLNVRVEEGRLVFDALETAAKGDKFAHLIFDKYEAKELRMFSVGFIPLEWKFYDEEDEEVDSFMDAHKVVYTKSELLEISAVGIGCLREAQVSNMLAKRFGPTGQLRKDEVHAVLARDERVMNRAEISNPDASIALFANQHVESIKALVEKEGRVLSAKNRTLINNAVGALKELLDATDPNLGEEDSKNIPTLPSIRLSGEGHIATWEYGKPEIEKIEALESENERLKRLVIINQRIATALLIAQKGKARIH